jgi:hypothetical protein
MQSGWLKDVRGRVRLSGAMAWTGLCADLNSSPQVFLFERFFSAGSAYAKRKIWKQKNSS